MAVTMRDVAAKAGVSPVVVSRVLHNKATAIRVSDATADRVRKAAVDLGYRCNVWARNFRVQQTMAIAILHGIGFERPLFNKGSRYFSALVDGIVEGAFKNGYSITLCPRLLSQSPEDAMADGRFDGLVWYSNVPSDENRKMLMGSSVPLVVIHSRLEDVEHRFPTVICDNDQGIGLAVDHLVSLGHRRIAFATEYDYASSETGLRYEAFRRHMKRLNLHEDSMDLLDFSPGDETIGAYLSCSPPHTGIVCHSDGLAAKILTAAPGYGVSIPKDMSIIGFDSTSYCDELRPTLTSVSQPLFAMGERAIDLLVNVIGNDLAVPVEVMKSCGLDIRESTGPAPSR